MISLLADAGCTLRVPSGVSPSLPSDPHKLRRNLESRFSLFLSLRLWFNSYIQISQNLKRVLIPASIDGGLAKGESVVRLLLLLGPIQAQSQQMLLEKLPEYFAAAALSLNLNDDVAMLIVN